jgi:tetratricopeptide (TPR) repeat protein
MTDTGSTEKPQPTVDDLNEATVAEAPAPEPWTAERVFEWNAYYDLYVAGFVILLVFFSAANKIQTNNSGIWSLLQAGRQMVSTGSPVVTDTISMAGEGRRWVNVPWLYELSHYGLYEGVASLAPKPEVGVAGSKISSPREQYGIGALIALDALVRSLAALLLLGLRRKGPGLWWSAICVTLALGVTLAPATVESFTPTAGGELIRNLSPSIEVKNGGIAWPVPVVAPENWGLLFLAIELLLLHQAINLGKAGRIYGLIPLFLVWANTDDSFGFGLILLAASTAGRFIDAIRQRSPKGEPTGPSPRSSLIVLGLCFASTFANPSHVHGVMAGLAVYFKSIGLDVGPPTSQPNFLFGPGMGNAVGRGLWGYYGVLVSLGLASFLLNRRNFLLSRFLAFVVASVVWALAFNYFTAIFSLVLVATLAINGQEWYQRIFGTEGRLGASWTVWSTGGRFVTIALIFAAIARGVTGWGGQVGDPQFGFGFNPDDFPLESAEALKDAPIQGAILNTSLAQGDTLAWKAVSKRKSFVDSRQHLYPSSVFEDLRKLRVALKDDDVAKWQPVLDRYKISAVMIQLMGDPADNAPRTYVKLMSSPNWVPFYDDGAVVMFGRTDASAPAADVAYFKANRLDADELTYKRPRAVPPWERPPTETWDLVDSIFQNRLLNLPQPHTQAAARWLRPVNAPVGQFYLPDPAHCLMAIKEARTALSIKPDDTVAFEILQKAYQFLLTQESALIAGIPLTPENVSKILQAPSQARYLGNRTRQLLTATNFRIKTLPPPKGREDQKLRAELNGSLAQFYHQVGAVDLARERFQMVVREAEAGGMDDESLKKLTKVLMELTQQEGQIQTQLNEIALNQRASPMDRANFARSRGAPSMAIHELVEANEAGGNLQGVRSSLVDLYCETGQADKAFEMVSTLNLSVDDPSLSTGIGTAAYRQGLINFLMGNYEYAINLWGKRSIDQVQTQRGFQAPESVKILLAGNPIESTKLLLQLPEKVGLQAGWEFEVALAALEGGLPPDFVADHFQKALKLEPDLTVRPVIAYYLEKLGKPVPPPRVATPKPAEPSTASPLPLPAIPPAEKSELPANVFTPDPAKPPEPEKPSDLPKIPDPPKP